MGHEGAVLGVRTPPSSPRRQPVLPAALGKTAASGDNLAVQVSRGAKAYHFTTIGEGVHLVEGALLAAGTTFTRTPVTVVWPGGRGEGVEFVLVLTGGDQRTGLDLVQRLKASGVWLLVRTVEGNTPM